jgi:hypothetical protein
VKLSAELEKLANQNDWDAVARNVPLFRTMLMEVAKGAKA